MSFDAPDAKYTIRDWSGGFRETPMPDTVAPNTIPAGRNCLLVRPQNADQGKRWVLAKRPGSVRVTPMAIDTLGVGVDLLYDYRHEAAPAILLAVVGGKVWTWDNVDDFAQVGSTIPFTPGRPVHATMFNNLAFLTDGTAMRMFDGSALWPVGFDGPTGPPGLAPVAATGPTPVGTYEGFVVWYDSVRDHESNPSPVSAQVAIATAKARQWTKPPGTPPAQVDSWRIYCRRVDTFEVYFMRVGQVPIATTVFNEQVLDDARNDPGPQSPVENTPPPVFEFMAMAKGYGFGVQPNSSFLWVSKQGDLQSWAPRDQIAVRRGDGSSIRSITRFGTEIVVQKRRGTFHLVGDQMPFAPIELHSTWGNVGPESAVEVNGRLYAWDAAKGPYWTDLGASWESLVDERIQATIDGVNRTVTSEIRATHLQRLTLVVWIVATGTATRRRTILAYNYRADCWLPPIDGLEYDSMTQFETATGDLAIMLGDYWGRVFRLFQGDNEGITAGTTVRARVAAATANTLTVDLDYDTNAPAALDVTGHGLAGLPVAVCSPGKVWEWHRIASNTATTITLDTFNGQPFASIPAAGWTAVIGGIQWFARTPIMDQGDPALEKRGGWFKAQVLPTSAAHPIHVDFRFDSDTVIGRARDLSFSAAAQAGIWGQGQWGVMLWGVVGQSLRKTRIGASFSTVQLELSNFYANQPFTVTLLTVGVDFLPGRQGDSI